MNFTNNLENAEKIEKLRNKMLQYILYKKRTETEIRTKFSNEDENSVEDAIDYFKELGYINDSEYVKRAVKEFIALKKMSIKELEYKISQKGVSKNIIDEYICNNKEELLNYEINSAKSIIEKKRNDIDKNKIRDYLFKKGYMTESISIAFEDLLGN